MNERLLITKHGDTQINSINITVRVFLYVSQIKSRCSNKSSPSKRHTVEMLEHFSHHANDIYILYMYNV